MKFQQNISKITIKQLIDYKSNGKLDLNPEFQRNSVWTKKQKQDLIRSILKNMPIPTVTSPVKRTFQK